MILTAYVIIVLLATTLGAIAGLGGGVIIKPLFDLIGFHDVSTIGIYSSFAVFTMCIVSIIKQIKGGYHFRLKMVTTISLGSLFGGICGEKLFVLTTQSIEENKVKAIQAILLLITLVLILMYTLKKDSIKHYQNTSIFVFFIVGVFLGTISIFLGIGGGPLNVATLMLVFSLPMKDAAVYSIVIIFFSQLSKISQLIITQSYKQYDLSLVPYICIAAIIGGFIGTALNQKLENKVVEKIYIGLIFGLIGICIFNILRVVY